MRPVAAHPCFGPVLAAVITRRARAVCQKPGLCDNNESTCEVARTLLFSENKANPASRSPLALWHALLTPSAAQPDRPQVARLDDLEQVDHIQRGEDGDQSKAAEYAYRNRAPVPAVVGDEAERERERGQRGAPRVQAEGG